MSSVQEQKDIIVGRCGFRWPARADEAMCEGVRLRAAALACREAGINPRMAGQCNLARVALPECRSRMVRRNAGVVFVSRLRGGAGLFDKTKWYSRQFGKELCDLARRTPGCRGFVSSDELPSYGFSRADTLRIKAAVGIEGNDVALVYAYDQSLSERLNRLLRSQIKRLFEY